MWWIKLTQKKKKKVVQVTIYSITITTTLSQRFTDNEFRTYADKASPKWTDSKSTVLCQWACGRGSNKRGLTQTNSMKSSKSSFHEIARDSGHAIGGSPILSGQIMRKSEEGLIICPWGHQTLYYSTIVLEFSTTESSQPIRWALEGALTNHSLCMSLQNCHCVSPCNLFWLGEQCF